jgi:two-component system, chemotaxis family, chemotaxis protein CheY
MTQMPGPEALLAIANSRILVIDDSQLMRDLLITCLKAFDVRCVVAVEEPEECIQLLEDSSFDAVIVDWRLRNYDGLDLVRHIRTTMPEPVRRIPIVLCTGYTEYARVVEARDSGIHEMLRKPVTPQELYVKLSSALLKERVFVISDEYVGPEIRRSMSGQQQQISSSSSPGENEILSDDEIFL